jgi:hypothetical protein
MSALAGTQEIVRRALDAHVSSFDLGGHYRALVRQRAAIVSLLGVVEEQDERIARLEERIGETIGMGG